MRLTSVEQVTYVVRIALNGSMPLQMVNMIASASLHSFLQLEKC